MAFTLRFISLVNHESVDALEIDFRISSYNLVFGFGDLAFKHEGSLRTELNFVDNSVSFLSTIIIGAGQDNRGY